MAGGWLTGSVFGTETELLEPLRRQQIGAARIGSAAGISHRCPNAPRPRRGTDRHRAAARGQCRYHRALPGIPSPQPRRSAPGPRCHRGRQCRQGREPAVGSGGFGVPRGAAPGDRGDGGDPESAGRRVRWSTTSTPGWPTSRATGFTNSSCGSWWNCRCGTGPGRWRPCRSRQHVDEAQHAHTRIVDAILDGDTGMAQHRARRHLEALAGWWL